MCSILTWWVVDQKFWADDEESSEFLCKRKKKNLGLFSEWGHHCSIVLMVEKHMTNLERVSLKSWWGSNVRCYQVSRLKCKKEMSLGGNAIKCTSGRGFWGGKPDRVQSVLGSLNACGTFTHMPRALESQRNGCVGACSGSICQRVFGQPVGPSNHQPWPVHWFQHEGLA